MEPLGFDDNGSTYWYFYGTRLYREDNSIFHPMRRRSREKEKEKEDKRRKKRKKKCRSKEGSSQDEDDPPISWQVFRFPSGLVWGGLVRGGEVLIERFFPPEKGRKGLDRKCREYKRGSCE